MEYHFSIPCKFLLRDLFEVSAHFSKKISLSYTYIGLTYNNICQGLHKRAFENQFNASPTVC